MTFRFLTILSLLLALAVSGCARRPYFLEENEASLRQLDQDFDRMQKAGIDTFGPGGVEVLRVAYDVLREGRQSGRWQTIGLEDLWAHAIKDGRALFDDPTQRWGRTDVDLAGDRLRQATIGPWQISLENAKLRYGPTYGIDPNWSDEQVYDRVTSDPSIQAKIVLDMIQSNYQTHGERSPYGIESYYWFERYVKGEVGTGPWDASLHGDTAETMKSTGSYGKQLLVGSPTNPYSLLYFLALNGKEDEIRNALVAWRDSRILAWDRDANRAIERRRDGRYTIRPEDLRYMRRFPREHAIVNRLVAEVMLNAR